jgi:hypothetical protein
MKVKRRKLSKFIIKSDNSKSTFPDVIHMKSLFDDVLSCKLQYN